MGIFNITSRRLKEEADERKPLPSPPEAIDLTPEELKTPKEGKDEGDVISPAMAVAGMTRPVAREPQALFKPFWYEGETCCLFGESGIGTTTLAMQIALVVGQSRPVAFFSLDLSTEQIVRRYGIAKFSGVTIYTYRPEQFAKRGFIEDTIADMEKTGCTEFVVDGLAEIETLYDVSSRNFVRALIRATKEKGWSVLFTALRNNLMLEYSLNTYHCNLIDDMPIDNFVGMGRAKFDRGAFYLKQTTSRNRPVVYDEKHVMLLHRVTSTEYPAFRFVARVPEDLLLGGFKDGAEERKRETVRDDYQKGMTAKEIYEDLGFLSETWVSDALEKLRREKKIDDTMERAPCMRMRSQDQNGDWHFYDYRGCPNLSVGTLSLYSGKKDSKGTAIYSGDIVRTQYDGADAQQLWIVGWNEEDSAFGASLLPDSNPHFNVRLRAMLGGCQSEVAGNIFDNPELLAASEKA